MISNLQRGIASSLREQLHHRGYFFTDLHVPSQRWFTDLYALFERLLEELDRDSGASSRFNKLCIDFSQDQKEKWNGIPFGIKDRTTRQDKHEKIYFQWSFEFGEELRKHDLHLPSIEAIHQKFQVLNDLIQACAQSNMTDLFPTTFQPQTPTFPIVFKMVKYLPRGNRWATNPHCDKSILSWVLDSNDDKCTFLVAPHSLNIQLSHLQNPMNWLPDSQVQSKPAVAFPGLMAEGYEPPLLASPHAVLPVSANTVRYSCIAFLIQPNIGTFDEMTDVPYHNDLKMEVTN
jgi:hypothetical protein